MGSEDPPLERIAFLSSHPAHVQRILDRRLVDRLLQLTAIDELHIGNRYSSGLAGILVLEAAA